MKKNFAIFCLLSILFVNCMSAGNAGNKNQGFNSEVHGELYIEKNAGFSMYIPKGWVIKDLGQKYLAVIGPIDNDFAPNIVFVDEQYSGSISEYVDASIFHLLNFYADPEIIENEKFITNTGLQGRYITLSGRLNEFHARQRYYVIQNKKRTAIMGIIGSAAFASGERYDALFDECVVTFNWTK